jgi:cyclic-di-GMP-binding protein
MSNNKGSVPRDKSVSQDETRGKTMPSFDIVSEIDLQEVDNAINQVSKEISQRFDFRGTDAKIEFDKPTNTITLSANSEQKIETIVDILQSKAIKRGIDIKSFKVDKAQPASGNILKSKVSLIQGIDRDNGKKITKHIKELKMKVQASINDDKVRVTGKKRDDLQDAIQALKQLKCDVPLQFENFRD